MPGAAVVTGPVKQAAAKATTVQLSRGVRAVRWTGGDITLYEGDAGRPA